MFDKQTMISEKDALPGRTNPIENLGLHFINQTVLTAPPAEGYQQISLGLGCFWGAEQLFWNTPGVISTSVGYTGGYTPNPTYEEVCSGQTGHTEVVKVIYDPTQISLDTLLQIFWEKHDPTQGMRQGNDTGTQYRSAIYTYSSEQNILAEASQHKYQQLLNQSGKSFITTEISPAKTYYFAELYHQQYLAKNPDGYCGIGGTGVCFPAQNN
ncbi:peptide-methionine (S)-S-oxide reductase [Vibrio sp. UCD-FRSSP16_10]|uniref:peptide-methionine (S)-S-oxide reductase MsrA n=1 Tax=unclassified Vibrio TaxID=2614977 RepID=UPI000800BB80|nr:MULTISPECIES: peptide-methionine (S)-S-oxide reductase MsrA [unclassified Vibrio]OBT16743.1 peptide-methionine (S)-S-oxide reductase [Vibrio sp. UCD-FRSSP16_30]OBT21370.1 peptide-methionine (S)-S-oxide reductase [Vibrio sp. UCD-FRSSP16_10]